MKNTQVAEINIKTGCSELLKFWISKLLENNANKNELKKHLTHHSILIDDLSSPVISFYKRAFISANIKRIFKENKIVIDDIYFKSDFEKLGADAYQYFIQRSVEHCSFNLDYRNEKIA